jgi:hypothetical protein
MGAEDAMDWNAAIETNRQALKRVLASLVAMAGITGADRTATMPRLLHRTLLRLLRPAEAAARRLVIVATRGLVVTLPPPRPRKPKLPASPPSRASVPTQGRPRLSALRPAAARAPASTIVTERRSAHLFSRPARPVSRPPPAS